MESLILFITLLSDYILIFLRWEYLASWKFVASDNMRLKRC